MKFLSLKAMNKYEHNQNLAYTSFLSSFISTDKNGKKKPSIRFYRYACMIGIHLLFVLSFYADIQILEGDITGSRLLGFHLSDPFITANVILAHHTLPVNLLIGTFTILGFYALFAGRAFCAWVCPYNFLGEFAERINAVFVKKGIIKQRECNTNLRYVFLACFFVLSLTSGYLVFEIFNVVGIFSRFIIYGYSAAIWWVVLVFLAEIFLARRFWCRAVCPIGTLYALTSRFCAIKIAWDKGKCDHCGTCLSVCLVPKVLELTKNKSKNDDKAQKFSVLSGDCTRCGRCIDVCHTDALSFENTLTKLL